MPARKRLPKMSVPIVFRCCVEAIRRGELIHRESSKDKEFHFQNWFKNRLKETGYNYEQGKRNSYPEQPSLRACPRESPGGLARAAGGHRPQGGAVGQVRAHGGER